MTDVPAVTTEQIEAQVGARSFALGEDYARRGAIFSARRQGLTLKGQCEGTSGGPYRVQATLGGDGIAAASCSCPVGDGGHCKHVAALLLTWLSDPEQFVATEDTETTLERRSKAELIALIKQMLRQQPSLELLLETPLPVAGERARRADPEAYRRQVAAIFRGVAYEWGEEAGIAQDLGAIAAIGDGFLEQGRYANALAVYEAILAEVLPQFEQFSDEGGELASVVTDCVEALGRCLEGESAPAAREAILRALVDVFKADVGFGGFSLSEAVPDLIVQHASPEEHDMVAGWLEQALPAGGGWSGDYARQSYGAFLLQLQADALDDETYLRISRATGRTQDAVTRLLELGRVDEAIAETARASDYTLLALADLLVAHGHAQAAERLVRERAATSQDRRLPEWLKNLYRAQGRQADAFDAALTLFRPMPHLEGYRELRELAGQLGRWEEVRPQLAKIITDAHHTNLLIEVYLDEGEIDRALEALRAARAGAPAPGYGAYYGYVAPYAVGYIGLKVAEAAETDRPRDAREIYREYAEGLIAARGRGNYQQAVGLLSKVRALSATLGEEDWWTRYIADLRDRNRALRALKEELANAGL